MATYPWTNAHLDDCRQIGDAEVDPLAVEILSGQTFDQESGRLGYHRLLDLADRLIEAPELYQVDDSLVRQEFDRMPQKFTRYLDPAPLPDWVDAARLERASEIWEENMLAIIGVLYAASLPSCYLIAKGIPTLYQTGILGQHRYIYQRIYETGLKVLSSDKKAEFTASAFDIERKNVNRPLHGHALLGRVALLELVIGSPCLGGR